MFINIINSEPYGVIYWVSGRMSHIQNVFWKALFLYKVASQKQKMNQADMLLFD